MRAWMREAARTSWLGAAVLCAMVQAAHGGEEREQELLRFVREAHRASRDMIGTCSCKVDFNVKLLSSDPPASQPCSCEYWSSPEAVRARGKNLDNVFDYVWKDSVREFIARSSDASSRGAGRDRQVSRYLGRCDAWARALL